MSHLTYAFQEMSYRLHRAVAVIVTIALAVGVVLTVSTLTNAYFRALHVPFQNLGNDMLIQRSAGPGAALVTSQEAFLPEYAQPLSAQDAQAVRGTPGITDVTGSLLFWSADRGALRVVLGMAPESDFGPGALKRFVMAGRPLQTSDSGKALVDEHYAAFYQVKVGASRVAVSGREFEVVGVVRPPIAGSLSAAAIFIPLNDARELLKLPAGSVNTLHVKLSPGTAPSSVQSALQTTLPGASVQSAETHAAAGGDLGGYATRFGWVLMLLVGLGGAALVYRTFAGMVQERSKEIAVLRTTGWTLRDIRRQFVLETLIQSVAGALIGLGFSALAISALRGMRAEDRQAAQWISGISGGDGFHGHIPSVKLQFELPTVGSIVLISSAMLLAVCAAFFATRRLARIQPGQLLHHEVS